MQLTLILMSFGAICLTSPNRRSPNPTTPAIRPSKSGHLVQNTIVTWLTHTHIAITKCTLVKILKYDNQDKHQKTQTDKPNKLNLWTTPGSVTSYNIHQWNRLESILTKPQLPEPTLCPRNCRQPASELTICHYFTQQMFVNKIIRHTCKFYTDYLTSFIIQYKPRNNVEPPERTMLEYRVRRRSRSDFWTANARTSWIPSYSSPMTSGRNSSSGARYREWPSSIVVPSGNV